jgi:hypothetical protein
MRPGRCHKCHTYREQHSIFYEKGTPLVGALSDLVNLPFAQRLGLMLKSKNY